MAVELAGALATLGHEVWFHSLQGPQGEAEWHWREGVRFGVPPRSDRILVTSPHSIHLARPGKTLIHLQMLEHMFRPNDRNWVAACRTTYGHRCPLASISRWNIRELQQSYHRTGVTHYVGNGLAADQFPYEEGRREPRTVLVEGWNAYNPCKDVDRVAPRVAARLRADGCKIIAYGLQPPADYKNVPHEYHVRPSLEQLNSLYARATVLVKASRHDARSCSPIEAMAKGCAVARAIVEGDDDLEDDVNCLRTRYREPDLYTAARRLLDDHVMRRRLVEDGLAHVRTECSWDKWGPHIAKLLEDVK